MADNTEKTPVEILPELHECKISKRGKGAKGLVDVKTFGVPEIKDGKAIDFSYAHAKDIDTAKLIEYIEKLENVGHINECLMRGADGFLKSETLQANSAASVLALRILRDDLAHDATHANTVALKLIQNVNSNNAMGMVSTVEEHLAAWKKNVENLKAKGLWIAPETETEEKTEEKKDEKKPRLNKDKK